MERNRKNILNHFLGFLNEEDHDKNANKTPEKESFNNFHNEFLDYSKSKVPEHFFREILQKNNQLAIYPEGNFNFRKFFNFMTKPRTGLSFAGIFFFVVFIAYIFYTTSNKEPLNIASIASYENSEYTSLEKGSKVYGEGLILHLREAGEISHQIIPAVQENMNSKENIYLKSGHWYIATRHELLKNETWFYFPGGALRPIGTRFHINVKDDETVVNLTDGKIEVMVIDNEGKPQTPNVQVAPYTGVFQRNEKPGAPKKAENKPQVNKNQVKTQQKNPETANSMDITEVKNQNKSSKETSNSGINESKKQENQKDFFDDDLKSDLEERFPDEGFHEEEGMEQEMESN